MPLTFPTQAEQAEAEFRNATKAISLATIAKRMGASLERKFPSTRIYTFDDDTQLHASGTGAGLKIETHLP